VKVLKSIAYGYMGAVLAGLIMGVIGFGFGMSQEAIAAAATPTGIVFGLAGLTLAWWRPRPTQIRVRARRPRR
jgi:hypothetical protein